MEKEKHICRLLHRIRAERVGGYGRSMAASDSAAPAAGRNGLHGVFSACTAGNAAAVTGFGTGCRNKNPVPAESQILPDAIADTGGMDCTAAE